MHNEFEDFEEEEEKSSGEGTDGTSDAEGTDSGGVSGQIIFRYQDAASLPPRDDALPPTEIKRLFLVHKDLHKERVDKQKLLRKERAALKEGKKHFTTGFQKGFSSGSNYKRHPITNKAYFSGMDRQIIAIPSEFTAETNDKNRAELENRFTHRHVPKFNPQLTRR